MEGLSWLGKKEELDFRRKKFKGKNAGKIYQYSNYIDNIIRTRAIIFSMSVLVFYPVLMNYFITNLFYSDLFFERLVFYSVLFLISGFLFNKYRTPSIILSAILMLLIASSYILVLEQFSMKRIAFCLAILLIILSGIYYDSKSKKLKEELSNILLENQLIDKK